MIKKTDLKFWNAPNFERQIELIAGQTPWETSEAMAPIHRKAIESPIIKEYLDSLIDPSVLEIGCGVGRLLKVFQTDRKVVGIDFSPNMIKKAHEYVPNAELHVTDGNSLIVPNNYVDLVYSFLVFQHIQTINEIQIYINEAFRVLKPGGFLRIQTHKGTIKPNGSWVGHWYANLEQFAEIFEEDDRWDLVEKQEGLLCQNWLWVTVRKKQ